MSGTNGRDRPAGSPAPRTVTAKADRVWGIVYERVGTAFYDLFRVADGKLVEHWTTVESVALAYKLSRKAISASCSAVVMFS